VGGLSAAIGGDRRRAASTAEAATPAPRVRLAGRMGLAAAELDSDGSAQRSADVAGAAVPALGILLKRIGLKEPMLGQKATSTVCFTAVRP